MLPRPRAYIMLHKWLQIPHNDEATERTILNHNFKRLVLKFKISLTAKILKLNKLNFTSNPIALVGV